MKSPPSSNATWTGVRKLRSNQVFTWLADISQNVVRWLASLPFISYKDELRLEGPEGERRGGAIFNEGCGFLHIPSVFQSQVWLHVNVEEENMSYTVRLKHN